MTYRIKGCRLKHNMSMKYKDKKVTSLSDLLQFLKKDAFDYKGPIWFRGQSKASYKLEPSFFRYKKAPSEMTLIQKFKQNATVLLNEFKREDFEWLFIMQHHSVPTRLLDWTESPLVASFFACSTNSDSDGAIWSLLPVELNKNAGIRPEETYNIPSINDGAVENYSPFRYHAEKTSEMLPVAVISSRNTARMQAQLGTFTIFHKNKTPIEEIGDKKHVWRYVVPKQSKTVMLKELRLFGINYFQLFPELQSIGVIIKDEL